MVLEPSESAKTKANLNTYRPYRDGSRTTTESIPYPTHSYPMSTQWTMPKPRIAPTRTYIQLPLPYP